MSDSSGNKGYICMEFFIGLLGMATLISLALLISDDRKSINIRTVAGALIAQVALGAFVLHVPIGQSLLHSASAGVMSVIGYGQEGLNFIFGDLAQFKLGFIFAINVLAIVIFVSALISVLYHLKIMNVVIAGLGGGISKLLGTSRAESLSAAANIFVGPIEAPTVIRPFIKTMTRSEIFAVMTGGLASVAGGTMVGYVQLGVDIGYLLTAAIMTAPAGLLFAKLVFPETGSPVQDTSKILNDIEDKPANIVDAASTGAYLGMQQVMSIGAVVLAFVGLIALINGMLGGIGSWFGFEGVTLQMILSYVFAPIAWLMGVPSHEMMQVGSFIGQKLVVNEFFAYADFITVADQLSPKTQAIVTIALCGFANIGSMAFVIAGISAMAPERRHEIGMLGLKSLAAAFLANLMSGTIAGLLFFISSL